MSLGRAELGKLASAHLDASGQGDSGQSEEHSNCLSSRRWCFSSMILPLRVPMQALFAIKCLSRPQTNPLEANNSGLEFACRLSKMWPLNWAQDASSVFIERSNIGDLPIRPPIAGGLLIVWQINCSIHRKLSRFASLNVSLVFKLDQRRFHR